MIDRDLHSEITGLVEKLLSAPDQFLVALSISPGTVQRKILVTIDGAVSIADCTRLAKALLKDLETIFSEDEKYTLEVSTPGLDVPLKVHRQYVKNQGRQLHITLKNKNIIEGPLVSATESTVYIGKNLKKGEQQQTIDIPFDQIEKALVQISFK